MIDELQMERLYHVYSRHQSRFGYSVLSFEDWKQKQIDCRKRQDELIAERKKIKNDRDK